jgi:two-component system, NtrC family, sensor histidine kinase HydH
MKRFRTRVLLPVVAVAVCSLVLGGLTATSLIWQQADLAGTFRENLGSRRVAIELDECLTDLFLLVRNRADADVDPLHRRVREHLAKIRRYADQPTERQLADALDAGFERHPTVGAADVLEADVLRPCREYKPFNSARLDENTRRHDADLRTLD